METNNSDTIEGKKLDTFKYKNNVNRTKYISSKYKPYVHTYPKLWAINREFSSGICGGKKTTLPITRPKHPFGAEKKKTAGCISWDICI